YSCDRWILKDLNKELSRKLEAQTQRLELLATQSMAAENTMTRLPESRTVQENPAYADEGDEVVERVLGWIMKLFPGGPSKRRTSKLL
ncbi:Protein BLISTER, partial [Linum perenne]